MMYASIFFYLLPTDSEKIAKFHCVVSLDFLLKISGNVVYFLNC